MHQESNPFLTSPIDSDWFLRSLVQAVNRHDLMLGITLTVGGTLITGTLVPGHEYFRDLAEQVAASADDDEEAAQQLRDTFASLGAIYARGGKDGDQLPSYIHLRDVRFFSPGGGSLPDHDGVWWRGRIDQVQGFVLGNVVA